MNNFQSTYTRVLAIAPSSKGFGFALFEDQETLVDWGTKSVQGDKNTQCVVKVKEIVMHYQPNEIVLEDHSGKDSRRSSRIRALSRQIIALAETLGVSVVPITREHVRQVFFADGGGTKHEIAEILAKRFPEELGHRLPPKRKPWESEDPPMDMFDAVALAAGLPLGEPNR